MAANVIRRETCYRPHGFGYVKFRAPVVKCDCGKEVVCEHFTNTCECGADYNRSGQMLASREQWGEETGEHLGDILRIP